MTPDDPLDDVLDALAAPGTLDELGGEARAVRAYRGAAASRRHDGRRTAAPRALRLGPHALVGLVVAVTATAGGVTMAGATSMSVPRALSAVVGAVGGGHDDVPGSGTRPGPLAGPSGGGADVADLSADRRDGPGSGVGADDDGHPVAAGAAGAGPRVGPQPGTRAGTQVGTQPVGRRQQPAAGDATASGGPGDPHGGVPPLGAGATAGPQTSPTGTSGAGASPGPSLTPGVPAPTTGTPTTGPRSRPTTGPTTRPTTRPTAPPDGRPGPPSSRPTTRPTGRPTVLPPGDPRPRPSGDRETVRPTGRPTTAPTPVR